MNKDGKVFSSIGPYTGFSIGVVVRVGQTLPTDPQRAKLIANYSLVLIIIVGTIVGLCMYTFQDLIIGVFTKDLEVKDVTKQIWPFVCLHMLAEYILAVQSAIMRGLAMQWRTAICMTCCLWFGLLPSVLWVAVKNNGGLLSLWTLVPGGYFIMQGVLRLSYAFVDWDEKSFLAKEKMRRQSSKSTGNIVDESTLLLPLENDSIASS